MAIDWKRLRDIVKNPQIQSDNKVGLPKQQLKAILELVDKLQGDDGEITAKVGIMDVSLKAGEDGVLGTKDDKVTIKRSSRKRATAKKKAPAKKKAAAKKPAKK
jgi:hypothetical protein